MADGTGIEWTDATWNPVRGCSRVSQGCVNCYAERVAHRFSGPGQPYAGLTNEHGRWNGTVRVVRDALDQPRRWRKPRRIFVNSMSDLFHESLPYDVILAIFTVMASPDCRRHTLQVLTKRPERAAELASRLPWAPNIWLGTSVENQAAADERIPHLLRVPARVRFLSCEPLIGPVDLSAWFGGEPVCCGRPVEDTDGPACCGCPEPSGPDIHWVIAGGESGPRARPMHPEWARGLRDQCVAAGVPYFFKQWGEWAHDPLDVGHPYMTMHEDPRHNERNVVTWVCSCKTAPMVRVGKARAGRELDGRTWDEVPRG